MERLAVDIGGTFVDAVHFDSDSGVVNVRKTSTTPEDLTEGVLASIDELSVDLGDVDSFIHGTTVGLNAVIEREGATTGIIANEGFRDVLELGRYDRPYDEKYNLLYEKPDVLVPRYQRLGVPGRIDADGDVRTPLDEAAVEEAAASLVDEWDVESIAVCLLHAYRNPDHERAIADRLGEAFPDVSVSLSSDITQEYREYERTSTAVMDAYIKPVFGSYVDDLDRDLRDRGYEGSFSVTRSGGGAMAAAKAKDTPVHTILSGPAGGIIGAAAVGSSTGHENLIAVDMGGTSLDTCVIRDGDPVIEYESQLETNPLLIPIYDIRTIGAGGGSIAWLDDGLLKVGPSSAGADPGPVCYGRGGTEPTVTDAALVLGYIDPDRFLGGDMRLDEAATRSAVARELAEPLDTSVDDVCRGVFEVMVGNTVNAIGEITIERGIDPRDFEVIAYGGAGPMVMPLVAREMNVDRVLIPQAPSVFSAWGMLLSDAVYDVSQTHLRLLSDTSVEELGEIFDALTDRAADELADERFPVEQRRFQRSLEMRYKGQEHTVEVPTEPDEPLSAVEETFRARYRDRYGHTMDDPIEVIHVRVRGVGETNKPDLTELDRIRTGGAADDYSGTREAYCFAAGERVDFRVLPRSGLAEGEEVPGPAIVREPTTTIVFYSDQRATVDEYGHLVVEEVGSR